MVSCFPCNCSHATGLKDSRIFPLIIPTPFSWSVHCLRGIEVIHSRIASRTKRAGERDRKNVSLVEPVSLARSFVKVRFCSQSSFGNGVPSCKALMSFSWHCQLLGIFQKSHWHRGGWSSLKSTGRSPLPVPGPALMYEQRHSCS